MKTEGNRMRLDKLLSRLGQGSRSAVRDVIRAGRVTVAGEIITNPAFTLDPEASAVTYNGAPLLYRRHLLLMLNKPQGVITAAADPRHRTVMDLLPSLYTAAGCMPIGRLDRDTEGLLLLTNDGVLAHRILSPKREIEKHYIARVDGMLKEADIEAFASGIQLRDFQALPAKLMILAPDEAEVVMVEGKYHQVKRMFQARGLTVTHLRRISIGPIPLDETLAPGAYRDLTIEERDALLRACGGTDA